MLEDAHSEVFVRRGERPLGELLQPMTSFLVPVFFVLVGFRADIRTLARPTALAVPLALTLGGGRRQTLCGVGVLARGASQLTVAIGMIPRGEVALVFAAFGGSFTVGSAAAAGCKRLHGDRDRRHPDDAHHAAGAEMEPRRRSSDARAIPRPAA